MKCVSYTRTMPWKNHTGELTITDQNQRIAEYLAEHKEFDLQKKYSDRKGAENASAAFDKMIDDGVGRKFDCIIVASMYYCGPGFPAARQSIKETLYETGVDLIVLEEGLDTRTASRKEVEDYFEEKRCEILLQSASFVPVDVHFIGIRIRKREKNYSIAATAVLTRRMERN